MHTLTQPGLTFSPAALHIDVRSGGTAGTALSDEELLQRARERALDPSVFDQYPPYLWHGEISSSRLDSYDTLMGVSSLKNYAIEASAGVAFLRNHNNAEDPIGYSLAARFIGAQGPGSTARVEADFYAVAADADTSAYVAKIRAGVVRDLSVGFYAGEWICSLCGRDMQQWFGDDSCPHLLGMTYTPTDEAGTVKGAPEAARATIENAHLAEVSGVYDGSTPGAMIGKARTLAVEGQLNERSSRLIEQRYRVLLPPPTRRWAGVALPATPAEQPAAAQPTQGVPWDRWPRATTIAEVPAWARDLVHRGA